MMSSKIKAIKKEIDILKSSLNNKLSASEKQIIYDKIEEKKREIEKICREEKKAVSINDAPIIANRKIKKPSSMTNERFYL